MSCDTKVAASSLEEGPTVGASTTGSRGTGSGKSSEVSEFVTIYARLEHLPGIKAIADCAKQSLGFVHRGALTRAIERREVLVTTVCSSIIGFCHFYRRRDGVWVIYHLAVAEAMRRSGVGSRLVETVFEDARRHGAVVVRLKCPEDLEANRFYERIGFCCTGLEPRQPRSLTMWERVMDATEEQGLSHLSTAMSNG